MLPQPLDPLSGRARQGSLRMSATVTPPSSVVEPGDTPSTEGKRSGVELIKENSRALRGTLSLELVKDATPFNEADKNLLKFHGSYQQEDRDARKARRAEG